MLRLSAYFGVGGALRERRSAPSGCGRKRENSLKKIAMCLMTSIPYNYLHAKAGQAND